MASRPRVDRGVVPPDATMNARDSAPLPTTLGRRRLRSRRDGAPARATGSMCFGLPMRSRLQETNPPTPSRPAVDSSLGPFRNRTRGGLDVGGVEHAANLAAHGGRGQVLLELGPDHPARPVRPRHLAPRSTVDGALLLGLGLVHVAQLLAEVEVGSRLVVHVLELDERRVVGLVRAGTVDGEARGVGVSVRFERGGMVRPRTVRLARGSSSLEPPAPRRATPDAERSARRGSPSGGNATVASSPRGVGWTPCGHANVARPSWG